MKMEMNFEIEGRKFQIEKSEHIENWFYVWEYPIKKDIVMIGYFRIEDLIKLCMGNKK
jgi:hypothetical protein